MTSKHLTIRSTSLCFLRETIKYLGVPVVLAAVIPRAWIAWVTPAKPMGAVHRIENSGKS